MSKTIDLLFLWIGGLVIVSLAAFFQSSPGYMDAEYYYAGGKQIWRGEGFYEPYIWNYLSDPKSLPVPSFTYWMPLASFIAWLGIAFRGNETFQSARLPFILLSSIIPPLTYQLSWRMSGERFLALFSGLLAWVPMFYLAYLPTTDTFGVYMILGTIWLILAARVSDLSSKSAFLIGIISGLMHLARADGLFWMIMFIAIFLGFRAIKWQKDERFELEKILLFIVGYGLIMGSWFGRNWIEYSAIIPPGNQRALFLREYNDLFRYPPDELRIEYLIEDGISPLIKDRLYAFSQNLQTLLAVQLQILLLPLFLLGLWRMRSDPLVRVGVVMWLLIIFIMSFIFPFAGWRGGYFHASAAFQPMVWCLAGQGFGVFINWGVSRRNWEPLQAIRVFSISILFMLIAVTAFLYHQRVIGGEWTKPIWDDISRRQVRICSALKRILGESERKDEVIMINDPIGFYLACEKPAVAVPVGGEKAIRAVSSRFAVQYLILEKDHPPDLSRFFYFPQNTELFSLIDDQAEWKIYRLNETP
ncbi:MAG: glycosyltransferase family 39 protein [Anaerolineales bacterium]|nr:glycosyltransferase family 39 protein [Anaerolineales bacterium]